MSRDYGSWSLLDLKNELRKRNAKLTGKKAVLVKRLEDYDKLFGPLITDPETIFKIMLPEPQYFRDVTSNSAMPLFSVEDLKIFCQLTEREDITTSKNMYDEYYLISCRIATRTENFVTAMVASAMRKNIVYNVTIKVRNHLILEAQCECAAGMGPYAQCKHVLVLLFGIIDFNERKNLKLRASSTCNLQTFHRPSVCHSGDPIKAEDLKLKCNDQKYKQMIKFDPRSVAVESLKFSEEFKNMVTNFSAHNQCFRSMPIMELVKPADKESVSHEHDYLTKTSEEMFLENLVMTKEQRSLLEETTRINKKQWKIERLMRLHSSNFGRILKAKKCKISLAKSLVKSVDITTAAIKHGIKYEEEAVLRFEEVTRLKTQKCGMVVHPQYQFLTSTPDRLVGDNYVLEVKCPFTARNQNISPKTVDYLYLCEQTGLLKLHEQHNYFFQVQGQLMCTKRQRAYFCIYTISDMKIVMVDRDDDFIKSMYLQLKSFYNNYFKIIMLRKFFYNKNI